MSNAKSGRYLRIAGALLFLAGFLILMGIIMGEVFYPGYSTAHNEISDLGATRPPGSLIFQPSAMIFNTTMLVTGIMVLAAACLFQRAAGRKLLSIPLGLAGLGILGVGIFPGNYEVIHSVFAGLAFISGGVAAILSARVISGPYRYISIVLGVIALAALFAADALIPLIGDGGTERWVAYPTVFWLSGLGAYLLGADAARQADSGDPI